MNEFNKLRELISSLSEIERKYLRRNLKQFVTASSDSSFYLLYNFIEKNNQIEYLNVVEEIYGFENKSAFKKLSQRLIDRILDLLISKDLLLNENIHSERNRELFHIKRRFLYYDILSVHGLNNLALNNLNQIIKSAKELEYYDYLLIALNTKLVRLSRRSGVTSFAKIHKEIEFYTRCSQGLNRANYLLAHYTSMRNSGEISSSLYDLNTEVKLLDIEYNITKSNRIKFALFYLKGILFSNLKQFSKAKNNFYSFYSHLKKGDNRINKSNDILNCLLNICEFEIKTFEFKKALVYFNEIDKLKIVNRFNLDIINEMKFLCFLSLGEINTAHNCLRKIDKDFEEFDHSLLQNDRIAYYNGIISFVNREFQKCIGFLLSISKIDKANPDWNICNRLLLIMCYIELEKYSLADSNIENLRKYMNGKGQYSVLVKKMKLIYKLLSLLSKFGYDFRRVAENVDVYLELIENNSTEKYFDYRNPYLIPFTLWLRSKLSGTFYDHSVAMRKMKRKFRLEQGEIA